MPAYPWPLPLTGWAGLGNGTVELVNAVNYARMPVTIAATDELTDTGDVLSANLATVEWPTAMSDWGLVSSVLIYDAPTGGNRLLEALLVPISIPYSWGQYSAGFYSPTPTGVLIHKYDRPRVSAAALEAWPVDGAPVGYGTGGFGRYGYAAGPGAEGSVAAITLTFARMSPCVAGTWAPGPWARAA